MKILVNKNSYKFTIEADEDDLPNIRKLENLMKSKDWGVMQEAHFNLRQAIIELVEDVAPTLQGERSAIIKSAILKGFDETASLPENILLAGAKIQETGEGEENEKVEAGWVNEV